MKKAVLKLGRGITWEAVKREQGSVIVIAKSNGIPMDRMEVDEAFLKNFKFKTVGTK